MFVARWLRGSVGGLRGGEGEGGGDFVWKQVEKMQKFWYGG